MPFPILYTILINSSYYAQTPLEMALMNDPRLKKALERKKGLSLNY